MEFADANVGWVTGIFGTVLRTTNGGQTFLPQSVPNFNLQGGDRLGSLDVVDAQTAFIYSGPNKDIVYRTTDGGAIWEQLHTGYFGQQLGGFPDDIYALPSGEIWAAGFAGVILASEVPDVAIAGDVNLDGLVNLLDVAPFVDRITNGTFQAEADINGDGVVNLLDVAPFVALISGG